jgi:dihydrofolate reductase
MPWYLPEDLAYFKKTTLNHTIVMGRKTFESIGKPLPKRRTIVLTRNKNLEIANVDIAATAQEAINLCKNEKEIFIVGGAEIYNLFLPLASRLLLTKIEFSADCDAHFPVVERTWTQTSKQEHTSSTGLKFEFCEFEKTV